MPISPYGAAKVAAELYCQAFAAMGEVETVSLRYFNVFGPRQDPHGEYSAVIPKFITLLLGGQRPTIFGDGGQSRDFTFIGDVVAGNLLAADAPHVSGRVFNVATGRQINLQDLIAMLNRLLKTKIEPIFALPRRPATCAKASPTSRWPASICNTNRKCNLKKGYGARSIII